MAAVYISIIHLYFGHVALFRLHLYFHIDLVNFPSNCKMFVVAMGDT